jgi:signal peptidase I
LDHAPSGGTGPAGAPADAGAPVEGPARAADTPPGDVVSDPPGDVVSDPPGDVISNPAGGTNAAAAGAALEDDIPLATPAEPPKPAWRTGTLGCIVEIGQTLVLTLILFFGIQQFVAQPFQVQQHSMERTFIENDYVLVDRLTPHWAPYQRGQVIVFNPPHGWEASRDPFIKRIIGVAGDTVEVHDGAVWVNGARLDEPYLYRDAAGEVEPTDAFDEASWTIGPGELFVMGDHRQASADSREFGMIPVSSVIGRGVVRYWPPSRLWIVQSATYDNVPAP